MWAPDTVNSVLKKTAFGFEKTKPAEVPSLKQEESVSMNAGLGGGVEGGIQTFLCVSMCLPF